MKVVFLGVGDAFDENNPCTSVLVESKTKILLDCGLTTPYQLWKYISDPNFIDVIYTSHFHADHYFGIPALFQRWWEEKRKKPIIIIGQTGTKEHIEKLLKLGYGSFLSRYEFPIKYIEVRNRERVEVDELNMEFLEIKHSDKNFAIKITDGKKIICYSGDGALSEESKKLYFDADILIHEAYLLDKSLYGHANVKNLIDFSKQNKVKLIAFVHLNRDFRKDREKILKIIKESKAKIILPENLQVIEV